MLTRSPSSRLPHVVPQYGDRSDVMGNDGTAAQGYLCTNVCNQYRWERWRGYLVA